MWFRTDKTIRQVIVIEVILWQSTHFVQFDIVILTLFVQFDWVRMLHFMQFDNRIDEKYFAESE